MKKDFSETLEGIAAELAEQNEAWAKARAALAQLDAGSLVSVAPDVLDELDRGCTAGSSGPARILSAFRA